MTVTVLLYGNLASIAGATTVTIEGGTVSQVLEYLSNLYGESFKEKLFDLNGKPRRFINIYINGRDYRFLQKTETELSPDDEISIIPAVSGG